jgi:predicted phage baseplate assembly protein
MPVPLPTLDDRTYQELVDGMRDRLPLIAPQWTDHNVSDPGITLLELLAFLSEAQIYRLDRRSAQQDRAFLRLMGCAPKQAQVANAVIVMSVDAGGAAADCPAHVPVAKAGGDCVFQTGSSFRVTDARLQSVLTYANARWHDRTAANDAFDSPYLAFGEQPEQGAALYLGFDKSLAEAGARMRLFVATADVGADWKTWIALRTEWRRTSLARRTCRNVGCEPPFWEHYGARVTWEFFDGHDWRTLPGLKDRTRALSLSGPVRWLAPADHKPGGVTGHDTSYFIRCRFVGGEYDCAPRIRGVRINAVVARHAADVAVAVELGRSNGSAHQRFHLPWTPVVPGSTRLLVASSEWRERPDFDRSGPHAQHYVLTARTGEIAFGDGRSGAVPEADRRVKARWQVGAGPSGNVAAGTISALPPGIPRLRVAQPLDAFGGADEESLDDAKARAFVAIQEERCAATLADIERVARSVPGAPVARAYAVAAYHPAIKCIPAAGCVTVVVVPSCVESKPAPSAALCRAVAQFIEPRRPLTLEVHVTGPVYTAVKVKAALALQRGADRVAVFDRARAALAEFLHPLHGGPGKNGWPAGRTVYRSEVLAVLGGIAGVQYVAELSLTADQGSPAHCGDVVLCANGLVTSDQHVFSVHEDGAKR